MEWNAEVNQKAREENPLLLIKKNQNNRIIINNKREHEMKIAHNI